MYQQNQNGRKRAGGNGDILAEVWAQGQGGLLIHLIIHEMTHPGARSQERRWDEGWLIWNIKWKQALGLEGKGGCKVKGGCSIPWGRDPEKGDKGVPMQGVQAQCGVPLLRGAQVGRLVWGEVMLQQREWGPRQGMEHTAITSESRAAVRGGKVVVIPICRMKA